MLGFVIGVVVGGISASLIIIYIHDVVCKQFRRATEECEEQENSCKDCEEEENRLPRLRELRLVGNEVHWRIPKDEDEE